MEALIQEMQWVLRAQCSDREALEALLRSIQPSLRRYLAGLAGAAEANDLLQDVLVIVIRRIQNTPMTKRILRAIELASKK